MSHFDYVWYAGELGTGSVRKKKMGFLQRMTSSKTAETAAVSSNLSRTNSTTPMQLSTTASPNSSIRKTAGSTQASPAVAAQRSVSPLGALMARNRPPAAASAPQKGLNQVSTSQGKILLFMHAFNLLLLMLMLLLSQDLLQAISRVGPPAIPM